MRMQKKLITAILMLLTLMALSAEGFVDVVVVPPKGPTPVPVVAKQGDDEILPSKQFDALPKQKTESKPNAAKVLPTVITKTELKDVKKPSPSSEKLFVADVPKQKVLSAEGERMRLERIEDDIEIKSKAMPLRSAIAMLAGVTNMRAMLPPETDGRWDQTISMRGEYRPVELLTLLEETYNFEADYSNGVYRFHMKTATEIVTRYYYVRHNNRIRVDIQPSQMQNSTSGNYGNTYGGSSGYGMGSMGSTGSIMSNTQKQSQSYTPEVSLLVEEVERIIDRPIEVKKENSYISSTVAGGGDVFFVPERNALVVTASTEHQKLVERYLSEVDRPARQVRLDVIFVETSRNPSSELGLDWEGFSGAAIKMDGIEFGPLNWVRPAESQLPQQTFVSMDALQMALNFLSKDEKSSIMSRSDVVVMESEYAEIRGVVEIPIKNAGYSSTGVSSVVESQVRYQEVGTIVGLVPSIVEDEKGGKGIKVHFSITSSIPSGESQIDGNSFPIIAKREYRYPVVIPDGHALAIGGLAETIATVNNVKVPLLGDIPALGYLFKKQSKSKTNRRVIAYIVPRIITRDSDEYQPYEFDAHPTLDETVQQFQKNTKTKEQL